METPPSPVKGDEGLAGAARLEAEILGRLEAGLAFTVCYVGLEHLRGYRAAHGLAAGDALLRRLAEALRGAARAAGDGSELLGRAGETEFMVVCRPAQAEPLGRALIEAFEGQRSAAYAEDEVARGGVLVADRFGERRLVPLAALSVVAVDVEAGATRLDLAGEAEQLRAQARTRPGSVFLRSGAGATRH